MGNKSEGVNYLFDSVQNKIAFNASASEYYWYQMIKL